MERLLITGFEPFDVRGYNTSADVLTHLPRRVAGLEIVTARLPVVWSEIGGAIAEAISQTQPVAAVGLGMSNDSFLRIERFAANFCDPERLDTAKQAPSTEAVITGAPAALVSDLPIERMVQALHDNEIPAKVSGWAGGYLCNACFYHLAHHKAAGQLRWAGFVHVPPKPLHGGWPVERLGRALEVAFERAFDPSVFFVKQRKE